MTASVTILLAVHNGKAFLKEAVASILEQTMRDFRFLIVDDASTDGTAEILSAYDDPRIELLRNPENLGLTKSLNRGLDMIDSDFVARMDADDIAEAERLEHQMAFLQAHPDHVLVGTQATIIDDAGNEVGKLQQLTADEHIRVGLLVANQFVHSSTCFRRFDDLRYDQELAVAQDYDFWIRLGKRGKMANVATFDQRLRMHSESVSATRAQQQREVSVRISHQAQADAPLQLLEQARQIGLILDFNVDNLPVVQPLNRAIAHAKLESDEGNHRILAEGYYEASRESRKLGRWNDAVQHGLTAIRHAPGDRRCQKNLLAALLRQRPPVSGSSARI